jgi:hypothetical protein
MSRWSILCIAVVLMAAGCARRDAVPALPSEAAVAVAEFSQPQTPWTFLAGFAAVEGYVAPPKVLKTMDGLLAELLAEQPREFRATALTKKCEEIVLSKLEGSRVSALEYWLRAGRCVQAEYLIVPHLLYWEERAGGDWSVESPASVNFDLFLIDVNKGVIARRFHFDERQQSLVENIFDAGKFFGRGGRWISTEQMAREGLKQGLKELGL